MFESIKRLAKHSAVYGVGYIVTRLLAFLLMPFYTQFLSLGEMGIVTLMFPYLAILTIIYTYGLNSAFLRFYIVEEEESGRRRISSTALFTLLISSFCFSGFLFLSARPVSEVLFSAESRAIGVPLASLVRYAAVILFFDAIAILPFLILRAEEKSGWFILAKFFNVIVNIGLNILFVAYLKRGVEGVFFSNVISSGFTLVILVPLILRRMSLRYSWSDLRDLLAFGLPYMPSTLSIVIMDTIDRKILELLAGPDVTGLYGTGARIAIVMNLVVAAFSFAWHPFFLSVSKQHDAKEIFAKVFTYVMVVCGTIFLFVSLFIDSIVRFGVADRTIFDPKFWGSTVVVPVIMLAYIPYAAYVNFLVGIYLEKKTRYLPFVTGAGMIGNLIANFTLIPVIGMMGAAWARVVAYVIMAVLLYFVAQRLYHVRYEFLRVLKLAVVIALLFSAAKWISVPWDFLFRVLLFLLFPLLLRIVGFLERTEIAKIRALLRGMRWQN